MRLIKNHIEEVDVCELFDVIAKLVIAHDDEILARRVLNNGLSLGRGAFIDGDFDAIEVAFDLCLPVVGDSGRAHD